MIQVKFRLMNATAVGSRNITLGLFTDTRIHSYMHKCICIWVTRARDSRQQTARRLAACNATFRRRCCELHVSQQLHSLPHKLIKLAHARALQFSFQVSGLLSNYGNSGIGGCIHQRSAVFRWRGFRRNKYSGALMLRRYAATSALA